MPNWNIRDPDNILEPTKQDVRVYAAKHRLTVAQAIVQLIKLALAK